MSRLKKIAGKFEETRTYQISGRTVFLDKLEEVLTTLHFLGNAGASRDVTIWADGDGAFYIDVRRLPDQDLKKNKLVDMKHVEDLDDELDNNEIHFNFD